MRKILLFFLLTCWSATYSQSFTKTANFFPIAVFAQAPYDIQTYKNMGVNVYYKLSWGALDAYHLTKLRSAHMYVMCDQDSFAVANKSDTLIYAWTLGDEPDNAQWNSNTNKYDSCIHPSIIIDQYNAYKAVDSTRPVALNLGQGVSNTSWGGRGPCTNWIASYPTYNNGYLNACDICSFDIYPVNSKHANVTNNLWYVPKGIDSLIAWAPGTQKPMWSWIETNQINSSSPGKPTPAQTKSEVWMAIIHGAKGFGYFCHSWYPVFDANATLLDTPMVTEITSINNTVTSLAPVLNSASTQGYATVTSSDTAIPVDIMTKNHNGYDYIFSVAMRSGTTTATFSVASGTNVEVIGEGRTIPIVGGQFTDSFTDYGVHLYKIQSITTDNNLVSTNTPRLSIYPNPFQEETNIQFANLNENARLVIYNMMGEIVHEELLRKNSHQYTLHHQLLNKPGVYFINVQSGNKQTWERIVFTGNQLHQ